jgi:hypothetical protein
MTTVTGNIQSAAGETNPAWLTFTSRSTPQFGPGNIIANTRKLVYADEAGNFTVDLVAGYYGVFINTGGLTTQLVISVPDDDGTYTIDALVTSSVSAAPGAALVKTGSADPEGNVTAPVGTLYNQIIGGTYLRTWIKTSGSGNTGWQ